MTVFTVRKYIESRSMRITFCNLEACSHVQKEFCSVGTSMTLNVAGKAADRGGMNSLCQNQNKIPNQRILASYFLIHMLSNINCLYQLADFDSHN